jgi:hypothetical protein
MPSLSPADYSSTEPMKGGARRVKRTGRRGKSGKKMNKKMNMTKRNVSRKMMGGKGKMKKM